jgi:hypothetical protein
MDKAARATPGLLNEEVGAGETQHEGDEREVGENQGHPVGYGRGGGRPDLGRSQCLHQQLIVEQQYKDEHVTDGGVVGGGVVGGGAIGVPAQSDPVHQRHGLRAADHLEPLRPGQLRYGHARAGL